MDGEFEGEVSPNEASDDEEALQGGCARRHIHPTASSSSTGAFGAIDSTVVVPFMFHTILDRLE